jgi:hypothetical protein
MKVVSGTTLVTGLPAPSAVLAALSLGLLPRPPGFLRPDLRLQHRDLLILRRDNSSQPRHQRLLAGHTGLIGHAASMLNLT